MYNVYSVLNLLEIVGKVAVDIRRLAPLYTSLHVSTNTICLRFKELYYKADYLKKKIPKLSK